MRKYGTVSFLVDFHDHVSVGLLSISFKCVVAVQFNQP